MHGFINKHLMSESSLDVSSVGKKPSIYEELNHIESVARVEALSGEISVLGMAKGTWGGVGNSTVGTSIAEGGVKMVLIDGLGNDETQSLTPERVHAEIVAKAVLDQPIMSGLSLAEAQLRKINKDGFGPIAISVSEDPLLCMMAFTEITKMGEGQFIVGPIAVGDVSILAFIPDAEGKFDSSSLRFLYFNPFADRNLDGIRTPRFHGVRQNELHASNPSILPAGSIVVMADDGGMEAILNPKILTEAGSSFPRGRLLDWEQDFNRMVSDQNKGKYSVADYYSQLSQSLTPLIDLFNRLGHREASSALFNSLSLQPKIINDDVAILMARVGGDKV